MKDDVHRICRNREAVIMGAALFLVTDSCPHDKRSEKQKQMNQREVWGGVVL